MTSQSPYSGSESKNLEDETKQEVSYHESPSYKGEVASRDADGTVNLTSSGGGITLVPAPSADPRDPLNLPVWRKWTMLIILSLFSCVGNTVISSAGSLVSFFLADYVADNRSYDDIVHLITVPALSMGLGNLLFVPIALGVGRRPVYLGSCILLFIGSIIASKNTGYTYHYAIRIVMGFAAGQSEALVPLMLKETFFIHERANVLAMQATIQTVVGCILTIFASNIAAGVGWRNWYSVYAGLSAFILVVSWFFVIETKYDRPLSAYTGITATTPNAVTSLEGLEAQQQPAYTTLNRPALDYEKYSPRTLKFVMNPAPATVDWTESILAVKHLLQMCWFPNVLLITILNSWYLGVNIGLGTTYATLLEAPPYSWADKWVGIAQTGQIVVAFVALPALGICSDKLITWKAKRNGGLHEPEVRLIPMVLPIVIGVLATVLYGAAWTHPENFHWFVVLFAYCGNNFAFIAASVAGQTYLLDSYPTRGGAVLTLVCAFRGIFSFGLTYSLVPTTTALGYMKAYGMYAGVMALLGFACFGLYFKGKAIRVWTQRYLKEEDQTNPHMG